MNFTEEVHIGLPIYSAVYDEAAYLDKIGNIIDFVISKIDYFSEFDEIFILWDSVNGVLKVFSEQGSYVPISIEVTFTAVFDLYQRLDIDDIADDIKQKVIEEVINVKQSFIGYKLTFILDYYDEDAIIDMIE